jgi:hypothetical protein
VRDVKSHKKKRKKIERGRRSLIGQRTLVLGNLIGCGQSREDAQSRTQTKSSVAGEQLLDILGDSKALRKRNNNNFSLLKPVLYNASFHCAYIEVRDHSICLDVLLLLIIASVRLT